MDFLDFNFDRNLYYIFDDMFMSKIVTGSISRLIYIFRRIMNCNLS